MHYYNYTIGLIVWYVLITHEHRKVQAHSLDKQMYSTVLQEMITF